VRLRASIGLVSPDGGKRRSGFLRGSMRSNTPPVKRSPRFHRSAFPFHVRNRSVLRVASVSLSRDRQPFSIAVRRREVSTRHAVCTAWKDNVFGHLNGWHCTASTPRMPSVRCRLLVRRSRISCEPCHWNASVRRRRKARSCTASAFGVNPSGGAMYVVGLDIGYSNVKIAAGPRGALPRLIVRPA
jgi:hypothetical protein